MRLESPSSSRANARGFTMVELLTVMSILVIILGVMAPSFSEFLAAQQAKGLSYDLTGDLMLARNEALKRNASVTVSPPLGVGWEQGPTNAAATSPLLPDGDRVLASAGLGARFGFVSIDAGYLAAIGSELLGASGTFVARYHAVTHTVSLALTFRFVDFPWHADEPDFRR